jgi:uncharacterized protein (TIGR02646 family)
MIYIRKQLQPPQAFLEAVQGLTSYEELQGERKEAVIALLLAEQGELCAICERSKTKFKGTIEHFLPKSLFPHLQLDYFNLYVACHSCNGPKADHLIPPYIFDPRFASFPNQFQKSTDLKPVYHLVDNTQCFTVVNEAKMQPKKMQSIHHSAYIMQSSLDLMQQNRYPQQDDSYGSSNSLLLNRAKVWTTLQPKLSGLSNEGLVSKFTRMSQQNDYPEFVTLVVYLYTKEFQKRQIPIPTLDL